MEQYYSKEQYHSTMEQYHSETKGSQCREAFCSQAAKTYLVPGVQGELTLILAQECVQGVQGD